MAKAMQVLFNEAMRLERTEYVGAEPYEQTEQRRSYANGFKSNTVNSRLGKLELKVPQTPDGDFYPSALERGERSERGLKLAIAEMYVQGVSTRKVAKINSELCGLDVTSTQVSRAAKLTDEELGRFVDRYQEVAPKLVAWAEANLGEGLAIFGIPSEHRKRMRTTNMLDRQNRELKRRTRVATLFPNESSLLRLVTAVLVELSDDWETGMRYLTFQN
ncbi:transposase [Rubripirellula sp.]|nr:transposase [Rubripirellula sp.]MDB4624959.1 transposase [Rubripirellula sp.]